MTTVVARGFAPGRGLCPKHPEVLGSRPLRDSACVVWSALWARARGRGP